MQKLQAKLSAFLFDPISADGFGLMRMGWALTLLYSIISRWTSLQLYYSEDGVMGPLRCKEGLECFAENIIFSNTGITLFAFTLLVSLVCTFFAWRPRLSVFVSLLIIHMLHQRNGLTINGGDRVVRIVGFYLLIAPELRAFSFSRMKKALRLEPLEPLVMSAWPYRLLLWQFLLIYLMTGISKAQFAGWYDGSTIGLAFHHAHYMRIDQSVINLLSPFYQLVGLSVLVFQLSWGFLLLPTSIRKRMVIKRFPLTLKQTLIVSGVLFHFGILLLMEVGTFSLVMLSGLAGLLLDKDIEKLRQCTDRYILPLFSDKPTLETV